MQQPATIDNLPLVMQQPATIDSVTIWLFEYEQHMTVFSTLVACRLIVKKTYSE
jgi:hypothetical protein